MCFGPGCLRLINYVVMSTSVTRKSVVSGTSAASAKASVLCSGFLQEASDPTKPSQAFHTGRPGKPRPISALQPVMLTVRRLAAEVRP